MYSICYFRGKGIKKIIKIITFSVIFAQPIEKIIYFARV